MATDTTALDLDLISTMLPFDPFGTQFREDPYPLYHEIRAASGEVFRMPGGTTVALSHRTVSAALTSPCFGWGPEPLIADQFDENPDDPQGPEGRMLMFMDPPDHTRVRSLVNKAFLPRAIEKLRKSAEQHARELLEESLRASPDGVVDLAATMLRPMAGLVLSDMIGIPDEYYPSFFEYTKGSGRGIDPGFTLTPEEKDARTVARGGFMAAGIEMVKARRANPGDDLVSELAQVQAADGDRLTEQELNQTVLNLLSAGFAASGSLMTNGVLALLRNPGQLDWLRANRDQLAIAVEELLRYDSPVQMLTRSVLSETELGGVELGPGDHMILMTGAGNHDPDVYTDPDRLDFTRPSIRNLGFGHGIHFCVAAPIARLAAEAAVGELIRYDLELAVDQPERYDGITLRGLWALPVRVSPAS